MTWAARIPTLAGLRYPQASFVLDFANNYYRGSGAQGSSPSALPGYNFTRALAAYAEDTAGNLIQFASGAPRITNKGVLIEESRTNLLLQSQTFDNASWAKGSSTISADVIAAPDGTLTADKLQEDSVNTSHQIMQTVSKSASAIAYTYCVYAKASERSWVQLALYDGVSLGTRVWFNISSGTVGSTQNIGAGFTSVSTSISAYVNGWYKVCVTATSSAATNINPYIYVATGDAVLSYAGTTGYGVYIWGAQLEAGSFPTSYIPTTSASVTRPADVFYYSGLSALSALTVAAQVSANHTPVGNEFPVSLDDGTGNNRLQWFHGAASPNSMLPRVVTGGVAGNPDNIANGVLNLGSSAQAVAVASGRSMAAANGVLSASGGSPSGVPPCTYLRVGANEGGAAWNNYIQRLAIYPFAASDAQLQSISSGNF